MKRLMITLVLALVAAMTGSASTVYVKPTACGTGDGSSWANAMGDPRDAVLATFSGSDVGVIKLSKGIHKWSEMLYVGRDSGLGHHAFTIQGGFAGESEDETADNAANPTYLSFDANGDDRWVKRSLSSLATTGSSTATDCGLIVKEDGSVVWPDDSDDADALYSPDASKVSDNVRFLKLNDNNALVQFSDFTFLGAGTGAPFIDTTGGNGCKFKNVTFLGSYVKGAMINFSKPASDTVCENVKMLWTHLAAVSAPWGVGGQGGRVFKTFDIKGVYCGVNMNGGGIFYCGGDNMGAGCEFRDCTIEKCYGSQSHGYKAQALVFGLEKATSGLTITNCTFRRICSRGNAVASVLSTRPGGADCLPRMRIVDCLFEGNESYTTAGSGELDNFGIVALASEASSLEGCTFRNNTVTVKPTGSATAARAGVVTVTSPINASETTSPHRLLVNCTFAGNTVVAADGSNDATKTPRSFSRSVMVSSLANSKPLDVVLAHNTFAGTTSAEPDVVWTGLDTSCKVRVLNSIFNGPSSGYVPLATSASGVVTVENSLLNGCTTLPNGITGSDNVFSELPMGDWDDLDATRIAPVLRPAARFPALRSAATLNRFTKDNATYLTDAEGAHVYNDASSVVIPATVDPLLDAVGVSHPEGETTIGAVQTLTDEAENGATLHLSSSPAGAGTLTGGGSIQVVEKGEGVVSVTAVSSDPTKYTFVAWQNPDGSTYSTSAELTISALNADLQLTAVFSAPKTTYTFNLGAAGTFDENNQSTIVKKYDAGTTLEVPAFTIDEEHYHPVGWDVTPPQTVGTTDQTFNYVTVEKLHRIIRVDCNRAGEGTGDGSSWANAMTNIQDAIDTAAQWTGEVWIRQGVHFFAKAQADKLTMAKNVQILGGFEGVDGQYDDVDAERAARDPKLYESVISGDIAGDDPWSKNGTAVPSQKVVVDGKIAYPEFEPGHNYYGVGTYYPNANYVFDNSTAVLDETAVLDGVTLVSAITKNLNNGDDAHPTVRNCTFIGNGAKSSASFAVSNCTFIAISGVTAYELTSANVVFGSVRDCAFRYCNNGTAGKGVFTFSDQKGTFEIRDTIFEQCTGSIGLNYYQATVIGTEWGEGSIIGTTVRNCWTEQGVLVMTPSYGCVVSNCLFEGNSCVQNKSGASTSTGNIPYVMMRNGQSSASASYYNTTFRSNTVSRTVGDNANSKDGNAAILQATGKLLLANCTFDGNTVTSTSPLSAYPATASVLLAPASAYCGVVHSTFNDNTAADGDVGFIARTGSVVSYVVNSILAGGEGHKPVTGTGNAAQVKLWNSVAQDLDAAAAVLSESVGNATSDPQLTRSWRGDEPVVAKRVSGGSPARSRGRNVYLDKGVVCIPAGAEETAFINAATGAAVTPSVDKTMLADVFGEERPVDKATAGALQQVGGSMMIILR